MRRAVAAFALALAAAGCGGETIREFFGGFTPHERYETALRAAGLDQTALGSDWLTAAGEALNDPLTISPPYIEESFLDPRQAAAMAYRISLRRGQRIEVAFRSEPDSGYQVFLDLFVQRSNSSASPRHVESADSLERRLDHLARRDADYIVRVQPELLRGGRYSIEIQVLPSLVFPVMGRDSTAVGSWYGDLRDGGRRRHEGLDIFAPRGTPVIAAADGTVRSTRSNRLGGNVVWLRDRFGRALYYAHLDSQAVRRGDRVTVGDTVGFVGNSGNARSTPPHLHFGIYSRGSFDPYPALRPARAPAPFAGDGELIGSFARVARAGARAHPLPARTSTLLAEFEINTPLRVAAGTAGWYRVLTPDGARAFVPAEALEPADGPLRKEVVAEGALILEEPAAAAATLDRLEPGEEVPVLGEFGGFLLVQGTNGSVGWLAPD